MTNKIASGRKRAKNTESVTGTSNATAALPLPVTATSKKATTVKAAVDAAPHEPPQDAANAKLVRDSFTIPKPEYENLADLKRRALALGIATKKSELLRAGIAAMNGMSDRAFVAAVKAVPSLKTGRPKMRGA